LRDLIDTEDLPQSYGGKLEWKYGDEPNLDKECSNLISGDTLPKGPVLFVDGAVTRPEGMHASGKDINLG